LIRERDNGLHKIRKTKKFTNFHFFLTNDSTQILFYRPKVFGLL